MPRTRKDRVKGVSGFVLWDATIDELLEDEKGTPLTPREREEFFDWILDDLWEQAKGFIDVKRETEKWTRR